jgi:hypothetical protein
MTNIISKNLFGALIASAFLLLSTNVFADDISEQADAILNSPVGKCSKEAASEVKDLIQNQIKAARNACADLRGCKKAANFQKKKCKVQCKGLKGKAKAKCKQDCRVDKRKAKNTCREFYKTPECKQARHKIIGKVTKSLLKLVKNADCQESLKNLKKLK